MPIIVSRLQETIKMKKRVFLTGASGFIGANLARRLIAEGDQVKALFRPESNHPFLAGLPLEMVTADLVDEKSLVAAVAGCNYVFHCAGKISFRRNDYEELYRSNVLGTQYILAAALKVGVERFIYVSACAVFGSTPSAVELIDESSNRKIAKSDVYATTKKLAEEEVRGYVMRGLPAVIANPCTVYGAGDKKLNSGTLIRSVWREPLAIVPPGGTSTVAIADLIEGLLLLLHQGIAGENYILANENLSYSELIGIIMSVCGRKAPKLKIPRFCQYPAVALAAASERFGVGNYLLSSQLARELFRYKYYSSLKARKELGWQPRETIAVAVSRAIDFYKYNGLL